MTPSEEMLERIAKALEDIAKDSQRIARTLESIDATLEYAHDVAPGVVVSEDGRDL